MCQVDSVSHNPKKLKQLLFKFGIENVITDLHALNESNRLRSIIKPSHHGNVETYHQVTPQLTRLVAGFLTAAPRVRTRVWPFRICVTQSGVGARFLWVLRFPLSIFIQPIDPQSPSSVSQSWYNRPVSVRSTKWTQSHRTGNNIKNLWSQSCGDCTAVHCELRCRSS
jgi:hypothetical protein